MYRNQAGLGLVEVIVAVSLLSIAVLGYGALQLRALAATEEASQHIQAMNLARDLAERIRVNRAGFQFYRAGANENHDCAVNFCDAKQMAAYDYAQVTQKAQQSGMTLAILECQNLVRKRQCIYVAWDKTTPSDGNGPQHCTDGPSYVANSKCIIVEAYNYVE